MTNNRAIYIIEHFCTVGISDGCLGVYDGQDAAVAAVESSRYARRNLRLSATSAFRVSYVLGPGETIEISTVVTNNWLGFP